MKIDYTAIKEEKEKHFLKMVQAYLEAYDRQNRNLFTPFYSIEWMQEVFRKYVKEYPLDSLQFFGGYPHAQRALLGFTLEDIQPYEIPIIALNIVVKTGIGKALTHRDFLGAILGLGIERDKIGDLVVHEEGAYLIADREIGKYIKWALTSVGRYTKISIEEKDLSTLKIPEPKTKQIETTVASLRADALFSVAFKLSRGAVSKLLQAEKGRCNGIVIKNSTLLKEGDIASLKGHGKIRLAQINGKTKKDRLHVIIDKYI